MIVTISNNDPVGAVHRYGNWEVKLAVGLPKRAEPEEPSGSTLMATARSSLESWARYTTPIPPAPSRPAISYRPKWVPTSRFCMTRVCSPTTDESSRSVQIKVLARS